VHQTEPSSGDSSWNVLLERLNGANRGAIQFQRFGASSATEFFVESEGPHFSENRLSPLGMQLSLRLKAETSSATELNERSNCVQPGVQLSFAREHAEGDVVSDPRST
jgi:hypothetical protein